MRHMALMRPTLTTSNITGENQHTASPEAGSLKPKRGNTEA